MVVQISFLLKNFWTLTLSLMELYPWHLARKLLGLILASSWWI